MCTKKQLIKFLMDISDGAKFVKFNYVSGEIFTVLLKCKVQEGNTENYNNYTKEWVRKFSEFTNTAWIVRNCFPNLKRLVYRKSFWCHLSAQNKTKTSDRTKNLKCKAKIDFRIKIINKHTVRNDADLEMGLNMNIHIEFNHSHKICAPECLNLLKTSPQSDSVINEYFSNGFTPSMAKCYHELVLIERYGQESEYIENASVNPSLRHIIYVFQKKRKTQSVDTNYVIDKKIKLLQQNGHTVKYNKSHQFVVIMTPLMGRVVTEFSIERVLIDVTPIHSGPFVMNVYVPTPLGSLPIASVIFNERSLDMYERILIAISSAIERGSNKCFEPKLVSVGNTLLKEALTSMFRRIVVKPDRYQIGREFWEFIGDDVNNVEKNKRHEIMKLFKSLIYADNIDEAIAIHLSLVNNDIMKPCLQKMEDVWQDWEQWMSVKYFNGKHIEAPIIFTKEFLIQKCKSFSLHVMMDVVTNVLESHFEKLTMAYIDNEVIGLHTKFLPKVVYSLESIKRVGPNDFIVPGDKPTKTYQVDIDTLCCDCNSGVKGRVCEHLTGVLHAINYKYKYTIDSEDKEILLRIASDANRIKVENVETCNAEASQMPCEITTDLALSAPSEASDIDIDVKQEADPLGENHDNESNVTVDLKTQYEEAMKTVNNEFRRLNKLFKDNPNKTNMETMTRLARELAKIRPVEVADFSNMHVQLNT